MGRKRKVVRQPRKPNDSDYDSDDERTYKGMEVPDPKAPDYWMDEVDEFNENRDKVPLEGRRDEDSNSEDEEEEILAIDYSDSSEDDDLDEKLRYIKNQQHLDEMASDIDEDEADENSGIPDAKAWGQRKKEFYNTDYVDDDLPGVGGSDEEEAQDIEEQEALAIQRRMTQMMKETDFDLQLFQSSTKVHEKANEVEEQKVVKDLSHLSKRDKLEILKKESPEFLELVGDFKDKLQTVIDTVYPLLAMIKDGRIPNGPGADYVNTRFKLYMNYCVNISFYMTLKAKHIPVHDHPVIARILAHKKLIKQLEPLDLKLAFEIRELLSQQNEIQENLSTDPSRPTHTESDKVCTLSTQLMLKRSNKKRRVRGLVTTQESSEDTKTTHSFTDDLVVSQPNTKSVSKRTPMSPSSRNSSETLNTSQLTAAEQKAFAYYEKISEEIEEKRIAKKRRQSLVQEDEELEEQVELELEDGKRAVTYQISKNKGLTAHQKKEKRNARVKHKLRFKKAKVRRKGQVREVRTETTRYGGEASGIRAGVIKSIKIK